MAKTRNVEGDIYIYYGDLDTAASSMRCRCSRWDVQDYNIILETWMNKSQFDSVRNNLRPTAVTEFYKLIERTVYCDSTWEGKNTLRLVPDISSQSSLSAMRRETLIFPKSVTSSPIEGNRGWIGVKIEGTISGSSTYL